MDDVVIVEASMLVASTLVASKDALTTVRFVNVPESAVNVDAETWVALNDAVPVTLMSPNVAVDALISSASTLVAVKDADATTRLVNVPVSLVIVDEVNPESSE